MSTTGEEQPSGGGGGPAPAKGTAAPAMAGGTPAWPANWYADPWSPGQQRYWDGNSWTAHVVTAPPPPVPTWGGAGAPAPATPVGGAPVGGAPVGRGVPGGVPAGAAMPGGGGPMWAAPDTVPTVPTWGTPPGDPSPAPSWGAPTDPGAPAWGRDAGGGSYLPPGAQWRAGDPPPAPPRGGRIPWVAVLAAMVVVALVAGVITVLVHSSPSSSRASLPTLPASPSTTAPASGGPPASTDPDQSALQQLALAQSDVGPGVTTGLINGGDQLSEPTLDLCNGTFASEQLRTARRQTAVADSTATVVFSTEAVLYQSPNGTAQAFTELRRVASACPPTVVPSPVGEPAARTTFHARPDTSWPQTASVERQAYDFDAVDQQGQSQHSIAVYLRRGRVLIGLYFSHPDGAQVAVAGQTTIPGIVGVFAARMAALPAGVVDRTYTPRTSATGGGAATRN